VPCPELKAMVKEFRWILDYNFDDRFIPFHGETNDDDVIDISFLKKEEKQEPG
jgi:hypothetical protein